MSIYVKLEMNKFEFLCLPNRQKFEELRSGDLGDCASKPKHLRTHTDKNLFTWFGLGILLHKFVKAF